MQGVTLYLLLRGPSGWWETLPLLYRTLIIETTGCTKTILASELGNSHEYSTNWIRGVLLLHLLASLLIWTNVCHSSGHPPHKKLGSQRTIKCITALKSKSRRAGILSGGESSSWTTPSTGEPEQTQTGIGKLTPLDVGMFAVKPNIKKES